jgi:hypothetical protein
MRPMVDQVESLMNVKVAKSLRCAFRQDAWIGALARRRQPVDPHGGKTELINCAGQRVGDALRQGQTGDEINRVED